MKNEASVHNRQCGQFWVLWRELITCNNQGKPNRLLWRQLQTTTLSRWQHRRGHHEVKKPFAVCPKLRSGKRLSNAIERSGGYLDPLIFLLGNTVSLNSNCTLGLPQHLYCCSLKMDITMWLMTFQVVHLRSWRKGHLGNYSHTEWTVCSAGRIFFIPVLHGGVSS